MRYLAAYYTDKGIRKTVNQDSLLTGRANYDGQEAVLAVICDGMGGLKSGELASAEVIGCFRHWFEQCFRTLAEQEEPEYFEDVLYDSWEMLLQKAHQNIRELGSSQGIQLGTTATAMLLWQGNYYIAHVGDCRIYEIKDRPLQLTRDQVQAELSREGRENVLLQGIGASKTVRPVYHSGEVKEDAVYLLCTDGFRHKVSEQELYDAFAPEGLPDEEKMVRRGEEIAGLVMERGERDNLSVILVRTVSE